MGSKNRDVLVLPHRGDIPYLLGQKAYTVTMSVRFELISKRFAEGTMNGGYLSETGIEEETEVFSMV